MTVNPQNSFLRRWAKRLSFIAACLVTLVVAFYVIVRWRGEEAWNRYRQEAANAGVKLKLAELLPPGVPDAENFAATPMIADLFKPGAPEASGAGKLAFPEKAKDAQPKKNPGKQFDSTAWREYFIVCGLLDKASEEPARDVLRALEPYATGLAELHEAGLRPHVRFPVKWEDGFAARLPHMSVLMQAVHLFCLRASAHLELREHEAAYTNVIDALRVHRALQGEPLLIHAVVGLGVLRYILPVVEEGLESSHWSDAELLGLEKELSTIRILDDWVFALESERAVVSEELERVAYGSGEQVGMLLTMGAGNDSGGKLVGMLYPRGWVFQNLILMNQLFDAQRKQIDLQKQMLRERVSTEELMKRTVEPSWRSRLKYPFVYLLLPAFESVQTRHLFGFANLGQMRVALALARYRAAEGKLPERLEELVPAYLGQLPHDPVDGGSIRYRKVDGGGYALWAVGLDGKDDGGVDDGEDDPAKAVDWVLRIGAAGKAAP